MDQVGTPQMLTYHAEGNNCNFGTAVEDWIFMPTYSKDCYGPEYPDPTGKCAQRINLSNDYINWKARAGYIMTVGTM
jgi:hypothetical protein